MMFTSIHKSLGLIPESLSIDMIRSAVDKNVMEEKGLDWKYCLPQKGEKYDWGPEFAKDVAAMANSGGGMIVFGVKEDGNSGAKETIPTTLSDNERNSLLAVAFGGIEPKVLGVEFQTISDGEISVVILIIPDSQSAPHFIASKAAKGYIAAPIRYGAKTEYLTGETLTNAIRMRYEGEIRREEALDEALKATIDAVAPLDDVSFVAVGKPTNPTSKRITKKNMVRALESARAIREEIYDICPGKYEQWDLDTSTLGRLDGRTSNPEFRKIVDYRGPSNYDFRSGAEVYFDGSISVRSSIGGIFMDDPSRPFNLRHLEIFSIDLVAFALATSVEMGLTGSYDLGLTVKPAMGMGRRVEMRYPCGEPSVTIKDVKTVKAKVWVGASKTDLYNAAKSISLDVINQGGKEKLLIL